MKISITRSDLESTAQMFLRSVCVILGITAATKIYSAFGTSEILGLPDPVLALKYKYLLVAIAAVEIACCVIASLRNLPLKYRLCCIAWLGANFAIYRISAKLMNVTFCPCVGTLTDSLKIKPPVADAILTATVAYILFGSLFLLVAAIGQSKPGEYTLETRKG